MDLEAPRILVVDDEAINRAVLAAPLERHGLRVVPAATAAEAVAAFRDAEERGGFDAVLLDVHLPDGDGLDVMQTLRDATTPGQRVPVILVTASDDADLRRRGLEAGADDFLGKPIDPHELVCRVRTFAALRAAQHVQRLRAEELLDLQEARADLARLLVHDLKNPLSGVVSNLEFLARSSSSDRGTFAEEERQALEDARGGARRLLALVEGLVQVEQAATGQLVAERARTSVRPLLDDVVGIAARTAVENDIALEVVADAGLEADLDPGLVGRALENLMANALRFAPGGRIELRAEARVGGVALSVANTGAGIPVESRPHLFEKYKPRRGAAAGLHLGVGLGHAAAQVEAHGGSITLVDEPGWAARFVLWLPS